MPKVFLSYVEENYRLVMRLANDLRVFGIDVWMDKQALKPGFLWRSAIRQGIAGGDYFVACFSSEFANKSRTYMNEELTLAIEELRQRRSDRAWFIPLKLNECEIPDREIGAGETLRSIHWVEMFPDWGDGIRSILSVVNPSGGQVFGLIRQLSSESARERISAADQLGKMGKMASQATPSLLALQTDPNETVRAIATWALGQVGEADSKVLDALSRSLCRGDYYEWNHAAKALVDLGVASIPILIDRLHESLDEYQRWTPKSEHDAYEPPVAARVFAVLSAIKDANAAEVLRSLRLSLSADLHKQKSIDAALEIIGTEPDRWFR